MVEAGECIMSISSVCVYVCVLKLIDISHCSILPLLHRNKAILFYFNMLRCANPAVLINLQCPTTQVGG